MVHINANTINSDFKENNSHTQIPKPIKKCPHKAECCGNSNHRTITRYGHELLDLAEQNMESNENKEEYKIMHSRSTKGNV